MQLTSIPRTRLRLGRLLAGCELAATCYHFFQGIWPEDAVPVDLIFLEGLAGNIDRLALPLE